MLKRSLGMMLLTFYALGMILGAGIYSVIGKAAGVAGAGLWMSFLFAAVAAFLTALSYAELSSLYPRAGAEYVYLRRIFPRSPILAFLCGSLMILASVTTAAAVALAFAGYLFQFVDISKWWVAPGLLVMFSIVNIWGVKESAWMNATFTILEILGLGIFIFFGIGQESFARNLSMSLSTDIFAGAAMIFFAYLGFESIVNLAEETKDPERTLPRSLMLSLAIATGLYILVSFSALALMPLDQLAKSDAVLSEALQSVAPGMAGVLGVIALFATGNTALIALLAASRIVVGMSREGELPRQLAEILPGRKTPWLASLSVLGLSLLFLPLERIELVASVSSFVTLVVFVVVNGSVIYLRHEKPDLARPFRSPLSLGKTPLLPCLAVVISGVFIMNFEGPVYVMGLSVIGLILLVYRIFLQEG